MLFYVLALLTVFLLIELLRLALLSSAGELEQQRRLFGFAPCAAACACCAVEMQIWNTNAYTIY